MDDEDVNSTMDWPQIPSMDRLAFAVGKFSQLIAQNYAVSRLTNCKVKITSCNKSHKILTFLGHDYRIAIVFSLFEQSFNVIDSHRVLRNDRKGLIASTKKKIMKTLRIVGVILTLVASHPQPMSYVETHLYCPKMDSH